MLKGIFEKSSSVAKLLQLLLITFFCFVFASLIVLSIPGERDGYAWTMIAQTIQTLVLFLFPPFILSHLWGESKFSYYHLSNTVSWHAVALLILTVFAMVPFINLLSDLNHSIRFPDAFQEIEDRIRNSEIDSQIRIEKLLSTDNFMICFVNLIVIAVLPAFCEELFFRGCVQNIFREWRGSHLAVWLAAVVFSLIHFQLFNFLPRLLWGVFFGYLLLWSGSLWLPVIAHFINNGIIVLYYFAKSKGFIPIDINTVGTDDTMYLGIISFLLMLVGFYFLRKILLAKNQH